MVLIRGKKGMFFILLAILLITFFILSFTFFSDVKERKSVQKRVETLNNFVFGVEEDIERRLFIAGFRIIFLLDGKIIETGNPVSNFDVVFEEAFYNGSYNGQPETLMIGASFNDMEQVLQERANKIGANLSFENPIVVVDQTDPWNVKVNLTIDFIAEDLGDLVTWNKTLTVTTFIPIESFGDPLYTINTNSLLFINITRTPYTTFVTGSDISNLLAHTQGPFYIANSDAPSFLDRMKGINAPNVNGIESLVDLDQLAGIGIGVQQKSVVDHIYFSPSNPVSCNVLPSGMPSWFELDGTHLATYEVTCV
jgi:hypothetical protein